MSAANQYRLELVSESPETTEALGKLLGRLLVTGDVICLSGDLGAGKTVYSRGIGVGWGATEALTSPTYNLAHEHRRESDEALLYHLDFYRIENAREAESLALDDLLDSAAVMVLEWPERVKPDLPRELLWIDIWAQGALGRQFAIEATGDRHRRLLAEYRQLVGAAARAGVER